MDAFCIQNAMATLTIKNFPDELYVQLTRVAKQNRRSINNEAIVSVERGLDRNGLDLGVFDSETELLERIRRQREELAERGIWLTEEILAEAKNELRSRPTVVMETLRPKQTRRKVSRPATTK